MQLAQLHMVKQILETGSLSKTALRLNWAQSVVSRQLAAFERECGGRIFYRNGRGVVLTELGERILPQIDLIINAAQDIAGCGAELRHQLAGEVKLAISPQVAPYLVGPLVSRLKQAHPKIRLSMWEAYGGCKADLKEGRTDIAVHIHADSSISPDERVIGELDTYLVGLPDSPATREETITFANLARLPLLVPSLPNMFRRLLDQIASRSGFELTIAAEVNAPGPIGAMTHAGLGYLLTPLATGAAADRMGWIGADVRAGKLRATRVTDPIVTSKLVIGVGANRRRPADAVVRLIETVLAELMDPNSDEHLAAPVRMVATG